MNNKKGFSNIVLIILLVFIIAGGIGYWIFKDQSSSQPAKEDTAAVGTNLNSNKTPTLTSDANTSPSNKAPISEVPVGNLGWLTTTSQELAIRFKHPADSSVSSVKQRETADGTTINELIVTPAGMDPTRVHFFSTNAPLDQAKNIQIYAVNKIKNSEFSDAMIDGHAGTRRIDHYIENDCTNELTVTEKGGAVYGFHITQCPSHPQGYDQLRKDITNSLELL